MAENRFFRLEVMIESKGQRHDDEDSPYRANPFQTFSSSRTHFMCWQDESYCRGEIEQCLRARWQDLHDLLFLECCEAVFQ